MGRKYFSFIKNALKTRGVLKCRSLDTNSRTTVMVGDRFNDAISLHWKPQTWGYLSETTKPTRLQSPDIISLKQGLISKHQEGEAR